MLEVVIAVGVVLVVSLAVIRRVATQAASAAVGKAAYRVLEVLYNSGQPLNLTEIEQKVAANSGVIISALQFLHARKLIASTRPVNNIKAISDAGRYYITKEGQNTVRRRRGLIA